MARLDARNTAGWNAGKNCYAKLVRISDIVIDPEISKIFKVEEKILSEIERKIRESGYDKNQPIVLWKDKNILVDGRTRLTAAKRLGLEEIPATEKEFANRQDALLYTFERQAIRRNLTSAEILAAAQTIHGRKERDGKGRAAERIAEKLGVSATTVYQARKIIKEAPKEELRAVQAGEKSIKAVYNEITKPKERTEEEGGKEFDTGDARANIKFLRGAVILLIEHQEPAPAQLLIDHFLRKNEKAGFYKLLPENIRREVELSECSTWSSK
jgi:ParB-like chromosome segregation protein Spo0J